MGWRFAPFDEELIKDYLVKRVRGDALPCDIIHDCEVYGKKPPWEIFYSHRQQNTTENKLYVFTTLNKIGNNRVSRTAAAGTWHLSKTKKIYDADGNHIGFNKMLSFKQKDDFGILKKTSWTMHELSLADALSLSAPTDQQCCNNVVLCVIYKLSHNKDEDAAAAKMPLKRSSSSTVAAESNLDEGAQQHSKRMRYYSEPDEFQALQPAPKPEPKPEPALHMPIPVLFSSPSEDILDLEIIFEELDDLAESHTYTDDVDSELAAFFADLPPMTEDWNQLVC